MRRRVLTAILSVTALTIVLFAVPLALVVRALVEEDATLLLEREAVLAAREVPSDYGTSEDPVELPHSTTGTTLGLYSGDGRLVAGSGPPAAEITVLDALANRVVDLEAPGARLVAVPVAADEEVIGVIRAEQPRSGSDARFLGVLALLAGCAVAVLGVAALIGSLLAGRLAAPVRRLRDAAVALGRGSFTVDVPASGVPELDDAADALTTTGQRLGRLVAGERAFTDDVSHQLRTPVAGLRAALEAELAFPREDRTVVLREALEDVDRLEATTSEILAIARAPLDAHAPLDAGEVLRDTARPWTRRLEAVGRGLVLDAPATLPAVRGEPAMVRQVLDVLLDNALRHGEGAVTLGAVPGPGHVELTVTDEGPGVRDDVDPAPSDDDRHGLGLPLARRYAEAMGGDVVVAPEGPSRVSLVLRRTPS